MPPRIRSKKSLKLPPIVLKAKAFFEEKSSKSLSVMKKLTESKDAEQQEALIRMWISLENSINKQPKKPGHPGDMWPHFFVGYVQMYSSFPSYFYQPKSERKKLVEDIKKHVDRLTRALKRNKFDHHLDYAESSNALYFVERMTFLDQSNSENSTAQKPTISEILYCLLKTIEVEVSHVRQTKRDSFEKARLFVYKLGEHLEQVHGEASNAVLVTVTKAIMNRDYTEADIHNIRKR